MPDYSKGKIYTIRYRGDDSLIYVGSTVNNLAKRWAAHKTHCNDQKMNMLLYEKMRETHIDDWYIELYEEFACENRDQLNKREGEVIREIGTLNKQIAGRARKEYRDDNKDKILEYQKEYRDENKEKISERKKEYRDQNKDKILEYNKKYRDENREQINMKVQCQCGGKYTTCHKAKHYKSLKHQNYIKEQAQNS